MEPPRRDATGRLSLKSLIQDYSSVPGLCDDDVETSQNPDSFCASAKLPKKTLSSSLILELPIYEGPQFDF